MYKIDIKNFYNEAIEQKKFDSKFLNELKALSTEEELKNFIEEKVQPIAKEMGYNFSTEEILDYEKQEAKKISEKQLENISGGVDVKKLALGGIVSLMALGAGIIGATSFASAELAAPEVAASSKTIEAEIGKMVDVTKVTAEREEESTPQSESKKSEERADTSGAAQAAAQLGEQEEQQAGETIDLETAKAAAKVDLSKEIEKRQLTDDQKLYVHEALNLQKPFMLLQSAVIENLRLYGMVEKIEVVDGVRNYIADEGKDFTKILYMLFPSNAGNLDVNGGGDREIFSQYGGITPELMGKFSAILNDYRNGLISTDKNSAVYFPIEKFRKQLNYNQDQKKLTGKFAEFLRHYGFTNEDLIIDGGKPLSKALFYGNFIQAMFDCIGKEYDVNTKQNIEELTTEIEELEKTKTGNVARQINSKKAELERLKAKVYPKYLTEHILMSYMIKTLNTEEDVKKLYQSITERLSKNETNKTQTPEDKKAEIERKIAEQKEEMKKLNEIINAINFENLSPYKNRTQSNGRCYKIGTLDVDGNVQIAPKDSETFADCADIAIRHLINLLVYSNEQNWDLILPKDEKELEDLNAKLKETVDAINSKEVAKKNVKFYDLKTRLQMFFLFQRGFVEGVDKEEDISYRSKTKADDTTPLARTLWEYAICNMNEENLEKGPDKGKNYYSIAYGQGNIELETGHINQLKLMWNIASALNLGSETVDGKTKLDLAKENINTLTGKTEYDETAFKDALSLTFSLFHPSEELKYPEKLECEIEKIKGKNEITGDVEVKIIKSDQKLEFAIKQSKGHAEIKHNPINFDKIKYVKELFSDEDQSLEGAATSNFAKLLLGDYLREYGFEFRKILALKGFLGAFSGKKLDENDDFIKTDLYKRYRALSAFKALQGEENNAARITSLLTYEVLDEAKKITVKQITKDEKGTKQTKETTLFNIFLEKYLEPNIKNESDSRYGIFDYQLQKLVFFYKFRAVEKIYSTKEHKKEQEITSFEILKTTEEGNEVHLLIKNIPENGDLVIPSKVYDETGKEYNVNSVGWSDGYNLKKLKSVTFSGDFDNFNIMCNTFCQSMSLQTVNFTGSVTSLTIGDHAFYKCNALESFTIPKGVTSLTIEGMAFNECYNLKSFTIPEGVTSLTIEGMAFNECYNLKSFTIPEGVTSLTIEGRAFFKCQALKSFTIPEGVTSLTIGGFAFNECYNLKSFTMPKGITSLTIEGSAFYKCNALESFTIPEDVTSLTIGGFAFNECYHLNSFTIPKGVTSLTIGKDAFKYCRTLKSFTIPEGVTSLTIGAGAFYYCDALKSFTIPEGVTSLTIGEGAFVYCKALKSFTIPAGVEELKLDSGMLEYFSIEKIYVPEGLKDKIPENFIETGKIKFYSGDAPAAPQS